MVFSLSTVGRGLPLGRPVTLKINEAIPRRFKVYRICRATHLEIIYGWTLPHTFLPPSCLQTHSGWLQRTPHTTIKASVGPGSSSSSAEAAASSKEELLEEIKTLLAENTALREALAGYQGCTPEEVDVGLEGMGAAPAATASTSPVQQAAAGP
jgi:hypothetical protein